MIGWAITAAWQFVSGSRTGMMGAVAVAALLAFGAIYLVGRSHEDASNEREQMEQELEAHERIDDADIGIGLDDDARRERLRAIGESLGGR